MTDARKIELSPHWSEALEILETLDVVIDTLGHGTRKNYAAASTEIRRMAEILDRLADDADERAEARAVFEIVTCQGYTSQPYRVTLPTNAAAQDYTETMQRAGYHAVKSAVTIKNTVNDALKAAAEYYDDDRLTEACR